MSAGRRSKVRAAKALVSGPRQDSRTAFTASRLFKASNAAFASINISTAPIFSEERGVQMNR
jgi:hypothetical protein